VNTTINYQPNFEIIREETNGNIDDGHYSENAHKMLSEIFIDCIKSKKSINLYKNII